MATAPNTDNYQLGKGIIYFNQLKDGAYLGERDLGNAPSFTFSIALEKLEHYSSRGGLKAKDKEIISQMTPSVSFTLDEVNADNIALLTLGDSETITQARGNAAAEAVVANKGMRTDLAYRGVSCWTLPYDTGTGLFVVGETIAGAGGATGRVVAVNGDATSGTLTIVRTNTTVFVADEVLTGGTLGAAAVNSVTGGTIGIGTPVIYVQDAANTVTYTAATDYVVDYNTGRLFIPSTSTITDGSTIHVTYEYAALTYTQISSFVNTQIIGSLRFVSDNPAGLDEEIQVWSVSLSPSGDTALIGEDWSSLGFTGEVLKDETGHPDNPYMSIIMNQTLS